MCFSVKFSAKFALLRTMHNSYLISFLLWLSSSYARIVKKKKLDHKPVILMNAQDEEKNERTEEAACRTTVARQADMSRSRLAIIGLP